jgi:hypothetical protein
LLNAKCISSFYNVRDRLKSRTGVRYLRYMDDSLMLISGGAASYAKR